MTKKLVLSLGAIATVVGLGASVISCADNTNSNTNYDIATQSYNSVSELKNPVTRANAGTTTKVNTLTPGLLDKTSEEKEATTQASLFDEKFSKITAADLQYDFDKALADFYESYEIDNNAVEIEVEQITVTKVTYNKATKDTPASISATLSVKYEQETEEKKETRDDNEKMITKEIEWKSNLVFIDYGEIDSIKEYITKAVKSPSNEAQNIDLRDLKEVFLGEKDDDDMDDIGVFDKILTLNGKKGWKAEDMGSLVGYEINLNYIMKALSAKPQTKAAIDGETLFKVPSIKFNTYFKPETESVISYKVKSATEADKKLIIDAATANTPIVDKTNAAGILGVTVEDLTTKNFISLTIKELVNDKSNISNFEFQVKYSKTDSKTNVTTETIDKFLVSFPKPKKEAQSEQPQPGNKN